MTIATFAPPRSPSLKSKKNISYRVRNAGFGDGYVQRAADGINTKLVSWDLVWNALTPTDAGTIESFLDGQAGYKAFYYTVPGDIQRKYTCTSFTPVQAEAKSDTIAATFTQVFDP